MKTIDDIITRIREILQSPSSQKKNLILKFQNEIWEDDITHDCNLNSFLLELAYDLDFYESDYFLRKESFNYYGDSHLNKSLISRIKYLDKIKHNYTQ